MNTTYCIALAEDVTTAMWRVVSNYPKTARYSIDETLVVLKWDGETPDILVGLGTHYDHEGITAEMVKPEWTPAE